MRQFVLGLILASAVVCSAADKVYQKGKYLDVNSQAYQKLISNPGTGATNSVLRHENQMSIQIDDVVYFGQCEEKKYFSSCRPGTWVIGDMIDVRIDKNNMYISKPDGGEVKTLIVKRVRIN
jgi:hypothetical protein